MGARVPVVQQSWIHLLVKLLQNESCSARKQAKGVIVLWESGAKGNRNQPVVDECVEVDLRNGEPQAVGRLRAGPGVTTPRTTHERTGAQLVSRSRQKPSPGVVVVDNLQHMQESNENKKGKKTLQRIIISNAT